MTVVDCVKITLEGPITFKSAQKVVIKIQAALRNGITRIHLAMNESTDITSAEFLAFLAVAARQLESQGGELRIIGANTKLKMLLNISRLQRLILDV